MVEDIQPVKAGEGMCKVAELVFPLITGTIGDMNDELEAAQTRPKGFARGLTYVFEFARFGDVQAHGPVKDRRGFVVQLLARE